MRPINVFAVNQLLALGLVTMAGCGEETPTAAVPPAPTLATTDWPISLRSDAQPVPSATGLTLSRDAIQLSSTQIELRDAEISPEGEATLRTALNGQSAIRVTMHSMVPYGTFIKVLRAIESVHPTQVSLDVRGAAMPAVPGSLDLTGATVIAEGAQPTNLRRQFADVSAQWEAIQGHCTSQSPIDCDAPPTEPLADSPMFVRLFVRGQAAQATFVRVLPPGEPAPAARPGEPAVGQTADQRNPLEYLRDDREGASFSVRSEVVNAPDSSWSRILRPVCGPTACDVVVESDAQTPVMRAIAVLGGASPNGTARPRIMFREP